MEYIVKTMAGLEEVLASELKALGVEPTVLKRAVSFNGELEHLYRANFELRTAIRVLQPVSVFRARTEDELYRKIGAIDWSEYMKLEDTLAVDGAVNSPYFRHSKYVALKTKDAIVDQFRNNTGRRPDVDINNPKLRINVHIGDETVTVALDTSGESLHKRGYRHETLEAPINEVLAAGMILLSGWQGDSNFIDPMCGSGTILIEAAMYAMHLPPQWQRNHFGFMSWRNFDRTLWEKVKAEALAKKQSFDHQFLGFDQDFKAISVSRRNAMSAGLEEELAFQRSTFQRLTPPPGPGIVVMNPPYDERLGIDDIKVFYKEIGDRLKQAFSGYQAWIISSNPEAVKSIGLKSSRKYVLFNGPLECRFLGFDLYEGSRKGQPTKED